MGYRNVEKVRFDKERMYKTITDKGITIWDLSKTKDFRSIYSWASRGYAPKDKFEKLVDYLGVNIDAFTTNATFAAEPEVVSQPKTEEPKVDEVPVISDCCPKCGHAMIRTYTASIPAIDYNRSTYTDIKNAKRSCIVKHMVISSGKQPKGLAKYYGIKKSLVDRKFKNDGFSLADIIASAYACDYTIVFVANDGSEAFKIDPKDFFGADSETWQRISTAKNTREKNGFVSVTRDLPADGKRVVVQWGTPPTYGLAYRDKGRWVFVSDERPEGDNPRPESWMRVYHDEEEIGL